MAGRPSTATKLARSPTARVAKRTSRPEGGRSIRTMADARWDAVLLDIDGVLHVGDDAIPGAADVLDGLRAAATPFRLVTNTTSRSRRGVVERLRDIGLDVREEDVLTPAALAVAHCRAAGHDRVALLVADALREDLAGLTEPRDGEAVDAVIVGDLGEGFTYDRLNGAFRRLMDGAALVALQRNRYWQREDGLTLDAGGFVVALEYASGVEATVVGKPSTAFFAAALAELGADAARTVMVGDDVEGDVGGAQDAGLAGVLVRTGKFREDAVAASGIAPARTIDSIADVPELLRPT